MTTLNVLLIEDHGLMREGMQQLLAKTLGIQVVAAVGTGQEGLALAREKQLQIIILDFHLPDANGLEVLRKLLRINSKTKILIVTAQKNPTLALQLLEAGAAGYLTKDQGYRELDEAIRTVQRGQRYISSDMAHSLALRNVQSNQHHTAFDILSHREMEIVLKIANGFLPEEIAQQLHIAKKTVHSYRYKIFEKLHIHNDLELLRLALKAGIVALDEDTSSRKKTGTSD